LDDDDDSSNDEESSNDNSLQGGDPGTQREIRADAPEEDPIEDQDQGVCQSQHKNKGMTVKYTDYGLMLNTQCKAGGSQHCAIMHKGIMFFLAEDLRDTKPLVEEDQEEWALGITLVHYSMGAGIKKFQERGEAGVTKELTQMHDMDVFCLVTRKSLS
jgi:hypothetical protein